MDSNRRSSRIRKRTHSSAADTEEDLVFATFDGEAAAYPPNPNKPRPIRVPRSRPAAHQASLKSSEIRVCLLWRKEDGTFEGELAPTLVGTNTTTTPEDLPPAPRRVRYYKNGRAKPEKVIPEKIAKATEDLEAAKKFGAIEGIPVGATFPNREALHSSKVHRGLVAGIFGDPKKGCCSVVLSGGYPGDRDSGETFVYTGEGGREYGNQRTAAQSKAQTLSKGNASLLKSCLTGEPVRVVRGPNDNSEWAPRKFLRYDGVREMICL